MSEKTSDWELSKENIRPLQKGRKTGMMRLAEQPMDELMIKRKHFENQLRVYDGDDPLSIWCEYIKWVEQSYPKGGREGNIGRLIQQCLSMLKDETLYQNDNRFIDIWLKFANMCVKPTEVYLNMHSHNIGCRTARFFIAWAWEMEQLGNFKKADEILLEGINRCAEPVEELRSEHCRLEMKMAKSFGTETAKQPDEKSARSAFAVLEPQVKNRAPVSRVGPTVHPACKENLTIGHKQPQPKMNSSKMPFSIYTAENQPSKTPPVAEGGMFVLNTEIRKENERKATKWARVKAPQSGPAATKGPSFAMHEDNTPQPSSTRKNAAANQILTTWKRQSSRPPMALFEPPDRMKRPMYNKMKVYGGAEEFSFEEIRAAMWFEKKKQQEQEATRLAEQQAVLKMIEKMQRMEEQLQQLQFVVVAKGSSDSSQEKVSPDERELKQPKLELEPNVHMHNPVMDQISKNVQTPQMKGIPTVTVTSVKEIELAPNRISPIIENNATTVKTVGNKKYCLNGSRVDLATNVISEVMGDMFNATNSRLVDNADVSGTAAENVLTRDHAPGYYVNHHNAEKHSAESEAETKKKSFPIFIYEDSMVKTDIPEQKTEPHSMKEVFPQDENVAPPDYVQVREKREIAGILQPSKNIHFIPLEEQLKELDENSDEEENNEDEHPNDAYNGDFTIIPPANTMQFAHFAQFVSTPCEKPIQSVPLRDAQPECRKAVSTPTAEELVFKELQDILIVDNSPRIEDIVRNAMENISASNVANRNYKLAYYDLQSCLGLTDCEKLKSALNRAMYQIKLNEPKFADKSMLPPAQPSWALSTIMETSREGSSKSSSSSCSSLSSIHKNRSSLIGMTSRKPLENISALSIKEKASDNQPIVTYCKDINPFESKFTSSLLQTLSVPVSSRKNYHVEDTSLTVRIGSNLRLGQVEYIIENLNATGAYAKIYSALSISMIDDEDSANLFAIKVCKSANAWEFYVCSELQDRLSEHDSKCDVFESVMKITSAISYNNGIILVSEMCPYGSLLNVINVYKRKNQLVPEVLVLYFTLEMLMIVSRMHQCHILHGDIKPDNFVLVKTPAKITFSDGFNKTSCVRIIDFGRAIDLSFFEPGITFRTSVDTDSFKCTEMSENKPWVHQPDWYGIMGTIHVLLFGKYMEVQRKDNIWMPVLKFKRYWQTDIWEPMFEAFLNMPNCYNVPDIKPFTEAIVSKMKQETYKFWEKSQELKELLNIRH